MFSVSMIVLTVMGLFAGFAFQVTNGVEIRDRRSVLYHGPLAPINHDGTVAFTPEVQQAKIAHQAAFSAEFQRLNEAAAHPDVTSPKHSYGSHSGLYSSPYNSQAVSQQYNPQAHVRAPLNFDGTGANTQEVQKAIDAQLAAFAEEVKRLQETEILAAALPDLTSSSYGYGPYDYGNQNQQYAAQYSQNYNYRPQAYVPAPLNKDGTVALTPEVQQATAAHQASIAAQFQRLDEAARLAAAYPDLTSPYKGYRSNNNAYYNPNVQYAKGMPYTYNSQVYLPAPLNKDGTVANIAEVQNAAAAQKAAFAAEFKRLQYAENLAAANPDLTSPHKSFASANSQVQYNVRQFNQGTHYAYNPISRIPAPLNSDGTVAHTAEYKAIAAAHQAEYAKALQRTKPYGYFSSRQQSYSNNYHGHY